MRTRFRGLEFREAVIFKGERWAEFSPFLDYSDQESATWLRAALAFAHDDLPALKREYVRVNATLPAVRTDEVADVLARFSGFETVKVKVAEKGQSISDDQARIREVARLFPNARVRLDANGGYSIEQVLGLVRELDGINIEYLEQPVSTIEEMAQLKAELGGSIKICADELIRKSSDPQAVARAEAADLVMLKAQPLGGIAASLEIAKAIDLECVVSSAIETSVGIAMGTYLACALDELNYDCGLGTVNLLAGDVASEQTPKNSILEAKPVEVDQALLQKYAAAPERQKFWRERVQRCLELL
jgi:O-succinylbenzoate synthase